MQDPRDARALTECMSVLEHVGHVRGAEDMYLVVSESGREYTVCTRLGACECPGSGYQDGACKHLRAVKYAIGERVIPAWVNRDAINNTLGAHVDGNPVFEGDVTREREAGTDAEADAEPQLVTDGGAEVKPKAHAEAEIEADEDEDEDEDEDDREEGIACACDYGYEIGCFPHYELDEKEEEVDA